MFAPAAAQHEHHGAGPRKLDTLTVRAERDAVQLRSGMTVMATRESAAAAGSIADFLRTVPGVELGADGRLGMRNSTSVLVLVNGRRTPLVGDALAAFLRQMPATALERVEAGTAPSARQGADGAAGVVNLVFRDDAERRAGRRNLRSVAGTLASEDHYLGSAAATGQMGDALDWDVMYSLSGMRPQTTSSTARWSLVPGDLPLHTDETSRAQETHRAHSVVAGVVARPTAQGSLALRGAFSRMAGAYRNRSAFAYTDEAGNTGTSTTGSQVAHVMPTGELSAVARVERERARFTSEVRTSLARGDFRGDYHDVGAGFRYLSARMASREREHVLKNDVRIRFPGVLLDVGHESRLRTATASHDAVHFSATEKKAFRHENEVHAGYLAAQRSTGTMRAEAGLRLEADGTRAQHDGASTRSAWRVLPSVSGEWTDVHRALVYRLAYGRRISRPGSEMLNPFAMDADDRDEVIGDPSLRPEVSDQVELGVERHGSRSTLHLTPFVRWTQDPIRPLRASTARGGTTTSLANLAWARAAGADAALRARPTDRAVVTLSGSVAHVATASAAFRRSGVNATARLGVDVRIAGNTTAQLFASRRSAQVVEQGETLPTFTGDVALVHRVAGGRGRVTLRVNDPWRGDRVGSRVAGVTFTEDTRRRTARPLLSLFASFAVGGEPREAPDDARHTTVPQG